MFISNFTLIAASRALALISNLLVAYVVSTNLSGVEQGFYYAFQSLGAAQFFFDLGIGFVLANVAGRRVASANIDNRSNKEALFPVVLFSLKWSSVAGFFLYVTLYIAGSFMFPRDMQSIWGLFSILVSFGIVNNSLLSIMEGIGRVLAVSIVRAMQSAFFVITFIVGTKQGMGMQALPLSVFMSTLPLVLWLLWVIWPVLLQRKIKYEAIRWRKEILPFQWRVAISWISGYFVFQAPISFLYKVVGPEEAGQLGLSMQIFQALTTFASILLSIRMKTWTKMAVYEQFNDLRGDLWTTTSRCIGVVIFGGGALMLLRWQLFELFPQYAERLVDGQAWMLLTFAAIANQLFYSLNYYFRAQGAEPLWIVAAAAGLAAIITAWVSVPFASIAIVVVAYSLVSIIFHAGAGLLIYRISFR